MTHPLVKISLPRRHAQAVNNGASSCKTNYIDIFSNILSLLGHQNRCIGSKVMAILLNGWILPTGAASSGMVCACNLRSRLVTYYLIVKRDWDVYSLAEYYRLSKLFMYRKRALARSGCTLLQCGMTWVNCKPGGRISSFSSSNFH